ncbi:13 kDa deflagellation-inducible protein [Cyclospora cayetanensis]|uniref:13 kDa deflagellation-inducible protein n=1 Tax=Cyclospora cayetanensis TaxID=88456 RepID=A0A6P6S0B4_9EIME|nr:13 kDa deflagellation-inducible protein [Cyclospora cayetanensis]
MAISNTNLHNYNHELVQCIDDLKRKRDEVNRQIEEEEQDKEKIQREIELLQERLQRIKESLARKIHARCEYDKTIQETEGAYTKILESAQTLLHVLKRESVHLNRRTAIPDSLPVSQTTRSPGPPGNAARVPLQGARGLSSSAPHE